MKDTRLNNINYTLTLVVVTSLFGVIVLGVLGYFFAPLYKDAVSLALEIMKDLLLTSVGVKGGLALPHLANPNPPPAPPAPKPEPKA